MVIADIKEGTYLYVKGEPVKWASKFSNNNIKDIKTFPYLAKIVKIDYDDFNNYHPILVEVENKLYGASLEELLDVSEEFNPTNHYIEILITGFDGYNFIQGNKYKIINYFKANGEYYIKVNDEDGLPTTLIVPARLNVDFKYSLSGDTILKKEVVNIKFDSIPIYKDIQPIILPVRKHIPKPLTALQQQIINILLYHPEQYRNFLSKVDNPGYVVSFINKLIPSRVGYEFDTTGFNRWTQNIEDVFKKTIKDKKLNNSNSIMIIDKDPVSSSVSNTEIRISFNNITGCKRLKLLLHQFAINSIKPAENGGLHIHINLGPDINEYWSYSHRLKENKELKKRIKILWKYRSYIYNVFGITKDISEYKSITAHSKFLKIGDRARVAVLKGKNTIEWRLANTTFDYTQIMKWTIFCHLMTQLVKYPNNEFNMDLFENIRYS